MSRHERNLVLAVDDEVDFLELIQQIGDGVGCDVITAETAAAFREQIDFPQTSRYIEEITAMHDFYTARGEFLKKTGVEESAKAPD